MNRRQLITRAASTAAAIGGLRTSIREASAVSRLRVLAPLAPDPVPPGDDTYAPDLFTQWKADNDASVTYSALRWTQLRDQIATDLSTGEELRDVYYMCGWAPEFSEALLPLREFLRTELVTDLPASAFNAVTWRGQGFGVPFTTSLLTLFYNTAHFEEAGLPGPPATWDELKEYAAALTRGEDRFGWTINYGAPGGIGSASTYWMAFLQQAGGTMYGEDGRPVFANQAGIDALQLMVDLLPSTDPSALDNVSVADTTRTLKDGKASMMMNWPFMWRDAQDLSSSEVSGKLACAVLPAGAAGTASIDGADTWTVTGAGRDPELAIRLVEFYLDPEVQKRQALDIGWLPARTSVLADPEVQDRFENVAALLEQSRHPYNSFITPHYDTITFALGQEIQRALRGEKTPQAALQDASMAIESILQNQSIVS
jgi:ABC-type glycerol-3-phosphate transport system substrate-binding protein